MADNVNMSVMGRGLQISDYIRLIEDRLHWLLP